VPAQLQTPALQVAGATQSLGTVQNVRQAKPLQVYGLQLT
jgi:hypothetical protein